MKRILACILSLLLVCGMFSFVYADEAEFSPAIDVVTDTNTITVTITDSSNSIGNGYSPTLSVPCDFSKIEVTYNSELITSQLEDGLAIFVANAVGTYIIRDSSNDVAAVYDYGAGSSETKVTATTAAGGTTVSLTASVSGSNATVTIKDAEIASLRANGNTPSGNPTGITIDLSSLGSSVNAVTLNTETFKAIESLIADSGNDYNYVEMDLPGSKIILYEDTVKAIANQAGGSDIQLSVVSGDKAGQRMNTAQKEAVSAMTNPLVLDISCKSGGKFITSFSGGTAAIKVPYKTSKDVRAWFLTDSGATESIDSVYDGETVVLVLEHFSNYVIEEVDGSYTSCAKDSTCPISKFPDAKASEWYHDGLHFCLDKGYISGMTENGVLKLAPGASVTRAQAATILWNIAGGPVVNYAMKFPDVSENEWYAEAVRWASSEGIISGYTNGNFGPNDLLTREQLAQILYGYACTKGKGFTGSWMFLLSQPDADKISSWANEAMHWAVMKGIMSGNSKGYLNPQGSASRAEAATMFQHFCEVMEQ